MALVQEMEGMRLNSPMRIYHINDGFYYYRTQSDNTRTYLRCIHRTCSGRASMVVEKEMRTQIDIKRPHNHEQDFLYAEVVLVKNRLLERAKAERTSFKEIFDEETSRVTLEVARLISYKDMKQSMYRARRLAKSSGDGTYSRTSSTGTPYTTTSATTTCGTTSSFTTTSLTTVSVTTTFSTTTTPSSRIYTAGCEPFTSSFAASIIKEELDIGSSNLKTEFDNINFENTYNSVDQLEAEYAQQCGNKRRRNDDSVEQDANTTDNTLHDEDDEKNSEGTEPEEPNTTPEPEEDCENRDMSDLLGSADTLDLRLNSILADNIFNCCNINPTRTRQHTHPPSSSSSREPYSTARLRYLDLEQRLRVYYLKTMIRKEEELMNIKVEVNKLHLMRDKLESENSRAAHLLRMENLHLENRLLKLRLQLMVQ